MESNFKTDHFNYIVGSFKIGFLESLYFTTNHGLSLEIIQDDSAGTISIIYKPAGFGIII